MFFGYFCSFCKLIKTKFSSQFKHEESKSNSKLTTEVERKLEPQAEEKWATAEILQGCEFSQPTLPPFFYFHLTPFYYFFLNCPSCFVGSLDNFVIFLDSEQYISLSQALYRGSFTLCNKIGAKAFSFPAFLLFSRFLPLSFIFSPAKHPMRMTTEGILG